jgi:hypothetical protein
MRNCLIILGVVVCPFVFAQAPADKYLYAKCGVSIGNINAGKLSLEYISPKGQSFTIAVCGQTRNAPGIPHDYVSPSGIFGKIFFLGRDLDYPKETRTTVYLATGTMYTFNNSGKTRFNLAGGIGCSYLSTPGHFVHKEPQGTAENYSYSISSGYSVAIVFNPVIDFAVSKYFGFSTGLISIISRDRVSCGIEISYLLGYVNSRKKNK